MSSKRSLPLAHFDADAAPESILEAINRDGGAIVDNLVDHDLVERIRTELGPYAEGARTGREDFSGRRTVRVGAVMARSPSSHELALHPLVHAVTREFLDPWCDDYQLHLTQMVSIGPGEAHQSLHNDRLVWSGHVPPPIETQCSTNWALTDFTEENGATRLVPGSQRWDRFREPEPSEVVFAEMEAGSVLIYSGSVYHGGGANHTDAARDGLLLHYAPSWLRQEENQYLSCPPEVAKDFSPELRSLIGYTAGFAMGFCSPPGVHDELVSPERIFTSKGS